MLAAHWLVRPPNQGQVGSALCKSSPLSVSSAPLRSSRNLSQGMTPREAFHHVFTTARNGPSPVDGPGDVSYQCTLPLAPGPPGVNFPSSDIFSPGTGVPDAADSLIESPPPLVESSDAHAESSHAITSSRTPYTVKRSLTALNVPWQVFDASCGAR